MRPERRFAFATTTQAICMHGMFENIRNKIRETRTRTLSRVLFPGSRILPHVPSVCVDISYCSMPWKQYSQQAGSLREKYSASSHQCASSSKSHSIQNSIGGFATETEPYRRSPLPGRAVTKVRHRAKPPKVKKKCEPSPDIIILLNSSFFLVVQRRAMGCARHGFAELQRSRTQATASHDMGRERHCARPVVGHWDFVRRVVEPYERLED